MSELKRCPCCGEEIKGGVRLTGYMTMNRKYIKCDACGLKMESSYYIDGLSQTHLKAITEDLIRRWNTRKPMQNIMERLEKELEMTEWIEFEERITYRRAIQIVKEEGEIDV